jgi:predicted nucleic acid-binding protein
MTGTQRASDVYMDMRLIGAAALHHDLTIVTSNLKHFERM